MSHISTNGRTNSLSRFCTEILYRNFVQILYSTIVYFVRGTCNGNRSIISRLWDFYLTDLRRRQRFFFSIFLTRTKVFDENPLLLNKSLTKWKLNQTWNKKVSSFSVSHFVVILRSVFVNQHNKCKNYNNWFLMCKNNLLLLKYFACAR